MVNGIATLLVTAILLFGCNEAGSGNETEAKQQDSIAQNEPTPAIQKSEPIVVTDTAEVTEKQKVYSNKRFRNVTVTPLSEHRYLVKGEAQVFEATISWVIEDGHNELKKGYENTDAGAPVWGKFNFTITAQKQDSNSTLHLILFESSAKDGSRQYEVPIPLY